MGDWEQSLRLVKLVLGCAVQCKDRAKYIGSILKMSREDKESLMYITKDALTVLHRERDGSKDQPAGESSVVVLRPGPGTVNC